MLDSVDTITQLPDTPTRSDHVVLLDCRGRPTGTERKALVHHTATPLHLAFSCYVIGPDRSVLITRRSTDKLTWPGVWTNACCGHPQLGETLRDAVARHLERELGCRLGRIAVALNDFTYRARMANGIVEHELCPVVVAEVDGPVRLNPTEAIDAQWIAWEALHARAHADPASLSPWTVAQLAQLPSTAIGVQRIFEREAQAPSAVLDAPVTVSCRAGSAPAKLADAWLAPVEHVLDAFLAERQHHLRAIDDAAAELGNAVTELVANGGKRLRPAFVYWGWRALTAGGVADEAERAALALGGAIELLHTFALLHDDVMDQAETRRGAPAARMAFAGAHQHRNGRGDPMLFGSSAATLAGDLAFVWADEMLDAVEAPAVRLRAIREVYGRLRTEVIAGQYLDLFAGATPVDVPTALVSERHAMTVALLKSARYTVTRPLELGAALAADPGEAESTRRALSRYGDAVGLAFQMRDDVLDMFGDASTMGKPVFGDLSEGKRTVLIERALRLADHADRAHLCASLGDPDLSPGAAQRCADIVASCGALASVETLIASEHQHALRALDAVAEPARAALAGLADLAVDRAA